MPTHPGKLQIQVDKQKLQRRPESGVPVARASSTRTNPGQPEAFLSEETSQAERNVRESPLSTPGVSEEFDSPPSLTEEEQTLLSDVANETGFTPSEIFERSSGVANAQFADARTEGQDVESPNPTSDPGLTNQPSGSEVILFEDRGSSRSLGEELIHSAQNRLGQNRVEEILDSVPDDNEAVPDNAEISFDEGHGSQPQEVLADSLIKELAAVRGRSEPEDSSRAQVLRSLFEEAGNRQSNLEALALVQQLNNSQ